jgi:glycyl-tRNA synthetase
MKDPEWVAIGEAVEKKIVDNETLGYFLARIFLFLKEVGVDVDHHVRFRQHMKNEMAHYAQDCWDAEAELSSGWLEIIGCADRSAYDLTQHTIGSGTKLLAARKYKEPRPEKQTNIAVQRQVIGKEFKKNSQAINAFLEKLNEAEKSKLKGEFDQDGKIEVAVEGGSVFLTKTHIGFEEKIVNVMEEKYVPSVIEPSFGLGRILTSVL